jgi:hypothetical protein
MQVGLDGKLASGLYMEIEYINLETNFNITN